MESKSLKDLSKILVCIFILGWICILLYPKVQVFFKQNNTVSYLVPNQQLNDLKKNIQVGDWIVRAGTGYESQLIQKLSTSPYSHIGVIVQVEPTIQIVHATTDDQPQFLNQVIISEIGEFVHPKLAKHWALYRANMLTMEQRTMLADSMLGQKGKPFVLALKTESHRYCSTIIADVLPDDIRSKLKWSYVELPGLKGELLFPAALLQLDGIEMVYSSKFN